MMTAAVSSSLRVFRIRPAGRFGSSSGPAADVRHDRHPGLEPGQPQGQLREQQQADGDHRPQPADRPERVVRQVPLPGLQPADPVATTSPGARPGTSARTR